MQELNARVQDDFVQLAREFINRGGYEIRLVGGAVRDLVRGVEPKDYDFATDATPQQIIEVACYAGFDYIETGLKHGTLTLEVDGNHYEVTTLRKDVDCNGCHAEVEFITSFREDAARRDFTFNAMSMGVDGTIHDFFGGQQDLDLGIIRFVGDTEKRIGEDFLRILRYFRFAGQLEECPGFSDRDLGLIYQNRLGLINISGERILSEMLKILDTKHVVDIINIMENEMVLDVLNLELSNIRGEVFKRAVGNVEPLTMLSLLIESTRHLDEVHAELKFSNAQLERLKVLIAERAFKTDAMHLAVEYGTEAAYQLLKLQGRYGEAKTIASCHVPVFPIRGQHILDIGIKPGPEVGKIMRHMKDVWVDSKFKATKKELLNEYSKT